METHLRLVLGRDEVRSRRLGQNDSSVRSRGAGYPLFRRSPPESPAAVLAVAGERRMNPVIGRQIAGTDPPSGVVNVQRIHWSALTPRALLQLAPVAGKVAAHMPDADRAIVHGERHAYLLNR